MKKALVIKHLAFEDLGNLAHILIDRDYAIRYIEPGINDFKKLNPLDADLLVVLGGPIGVYETDKYPFLQDEIAFIKTRLENELPTLGICLGAQLIAAALGAKVYPGAQQEIGWAPILPIALTTQDNYFNILNQPNLKVLHWHGDTFDLPVGATLLASTPLYTHQAFSVGDYALGLQFHLEIMPDYFERWLIGHAVELSQNPELDLAQMRLDAKQYGRLLQTYAAKFWNDWLDTAECVTYRRPELAQVA